MSGRAVRSDASARLCAMHQPNFFPWMGYFDKVRRSDVFVFLDAVSYPKSGNSMGSWCNRVRIDVQGKPSWLGCAVKREHGQQKICDVLIDDERPWRAKLLKTLAMNYRRSANFARAMEVIEPLVLNAETRLAEFNMHAIEMICRVLGVRGRLVRQTELPMHRQATGLLIDITKAMGCNTYLCGGGAQEYQQDEQFAREGVRLEHQNFSPQPYREPERFIPGLSVIDYLMHAPAEQLHENN
ncbi:MAG: WbqC family protein [Woeseiaceae bacterium]